MTRTLPPWMTVSPDGAIIVDPDLAYPSVIKKIVASAKAEIAATTTRSPDQRKRHDLLTYIVKAGEDGGADQYLLETALQCIKQHVRALVEGTEYDTRSRGMAITIKISGAGGRKDRWSLRGHAKGRGAVAAARGRESLTHYQKISALL